MRIVSTALTTATLGAMALVLALPQAPALGAFPDRASVAPATTDQARSMLARPLFGETHLHTANSGDAALRGTLKTPEDAIRFAMGEEIISSSGQKAKLSRPLDFVLVSDHGELIGSGRAIRDGNSLLMGDPTLKRWYDMMQGGAEQQQQASTELISAFSQGKLPKALFKPEIGGKISASIWQEYLTTSERYDEPGKFTVLLGYEYTSTPQGNNLHRIVIFRDGKDRVETVRPFSALESTDPERLWDYFDSYRRSTGGDVLAIPHNGNLSNGLMFAETTRGGQAFSASYARRRQLWEPLVEVVQTKGESEAHPFLSPNDEFASFGKDGWDIGNLDLSANKKPEMYAGEYAREALKRGLAVEARLGVNPFKFGLIGAGDLHTGLSRQDEDKYWGETTGVEPHAGRSAQKEESNAEYTRYAYQSLGGGLAAVWASANTREAIFDAMRRREVYATSGTRMSVRVFAGWDFRSADLANGLVAAGYARGVPMGGTLEARRKAQSPRLMISALKDPAGANLDRVQVIKGWLDADGKLHEQVYDVAWSQPGKRRIGKDGKLTPVGTSVDPKTAHYSNSIGAPVLQTVWSDPHFNQRQKAFYYVRVLEIPTPRWVLYDAIRYGEAVPKGAQAVQQERAWTSPIWFNPQ